MDALIGLINQIGPIIVMFAVPFVVAFFKKLFARLPKWIIPILAPAVAILGDFLMNAIAGASVGPLLSAFLGLAGIGIREIFDQLKKALGGA